MNAIETIKTKTTTVLKLITLDLGDNYQQKLKYPPSDLTSYFQKLFPMKNLPSQHSYLEVLLLSKLRSNRGGF